MNLNPNHIPNRHRANDSVSISLQPLLPNLQTAIITGGLRQVEGWFTSNPTMASNTYWCIRWLFSIWLKDSSVNYFVGSQPLPITVIPEVPRHIEYYHLVDVFRIYFLSSVQGTRPSPNYWSSRRMRLLPHPITQRLSVVHQESQLNHCVIELQEAGVKFKKKQRSDLLEISFNLQTGDLEIPPLYLDDNSVPLFLNFMAFELCDKSRERTTSCS
ncbi:Protein of unknown function DUF247 [Macleaya cordata]|uniref:Uncharacterized protein n=1 Tax=Macleaya cordata TaxID=56857 RepID=A0A200Q8W4_MACCD|nr:Protein of unknown function DUF247 [Macleaya cordata]